MCTIVCRSWEHDSLAEKTLGHAKYELNWFGDVLYVGLWNMDSEFN